MAKKQPDTKLYRTFDGSFVKQSIALKQIIEPIGVCINCNIPFSTIHNEELPNYCGEHSCQTVGLDKFRAQRNREISGDSNVWIKPVTPSQKKKSSKKIYDPSLCRTPYKKTYRTVEEAEQFISIIHPDDDSIEAYYCSCYAIHIGHSRKPNKSKPVSLKVNQNVDESTRKRFKNFPDSMK